MEISQRYVDAWTRISEVIVASNRAYASSEGKLFSFRYHQAQLRKAFAEVGLNCAHMHHRIDFMQVEAELVSLMDSVNLVFSTNPKAGRLPKRLYV